MTVVIVAGIGLVNYVLLRVYGKRGVALTGILGGLVNSTAEAAELATVLPAAGLLSQTVPAVLLTSVAMFLRNAVLLGLFGRSAVRFAVLPLLAMMVVATYFAFRHRQVDANPKEFGFLFIAIQTAGTLAVRWLGNSGVLLVSLIGGTVSSASTAAAAANLLTHGNVSAQQAGIATVLTSIASTTMNLPIIKRQIKVKDVVREIVLATTLQGIVGITILFCERWFIH